MSSSRHKTEGSEEHRLRKKSRPRASLVNDQSDFETRMRNSASPSPDLPPQPRFSNGNEQYQRAGKQKKSDHQTSPLSKWREEFTYAPKTPHRNHQQRPNLVSSEESEDEDLPAPPTPLSIPKKHHHRYKYYKNVMILPPPQAQTKPKPNAVEEDANSGDELALRPRKKEKKAKAKTKPEAKDLLKALEEVIKSLDVFSSPEEVAYHLSHSGIQDLTPIHELKAACNSIAKLLPSSDRNNGTNVPSTIEYYDKIALYLGKDNLIQLMQPLEVFAAIKSPDRNNKTYHKYERQKTFGLIRRDKNSLPLMCSFSGGKRCTDKHPLILDAERWTNLVKYWVQIFDQPLKISRFDNDKGPGHCHATHVEPRLLLWFGCEMVKQRLGFTDPKMTFEQLLGHVWELGRLEDVIEAELIISHTNKKACGSCRRFHARFCEMSGMKISLDSCPTVGDLKMRRNKAGNNVVDEYAYDTEWEQGSDEGQDIAPRRLVVEIRSKSTSVTTSSSVVSHNAKIGVSQAPFQSLAVRKAMEIKEKKKTKSIAKAKKRNIQAYVEDGDEDDVSCFDSPQKKRRKSKHR